jgi:VWFA-related protein
MNKKILIIGALALCLPLFSQEISQEVTVINIEVSVRVFKGSKFVDNLTIKDFELYEDGKLQKIEAVYLIKKTKIERQEAKIEKEEAKKIFAPEVSRNFILLFEIREYLPRINEAINYFFENVFMPGDTLMVVTPSKSYKFNNKALEILPKKEIAKTLNEKVRKDVNKVNIAYRSLLRDLKNIRTSEGYDPDLKRMMYLDTLRRYKNLRYVDQKKLIDFADFLKDREGQKYVFLFYQRELFPTMERSTDEQDILESLESLEDTEMNISIDVEKVKQAFSDSSISIHFLYITKTPRDRLDVEDMRSGDARAIRWQDFSGDMFEAFNEMAEATGGLTDSSANIASSFKMAVNASENYYLIYYAPEGYKKDGKYKEIKVKLKNKKYRITHRAGYFAN